MKIPFHFKEVLSKMPSSRMWHVLLLNFWLLATLAISHPSSQLTASNHNHEARDYVEITGLAAGAIYSQPPPGKPLYQNITATLIVPSVSPPAGAVPNQVYGAYFWLSLGTAPVLQAGVVATTVTDGSHSTTNYSAAWSWAKSQYETGGINQEVVDLGVNPSSLVRIGVGIMNGSQAHIKIDNLQDVDGTLERELKAEDDEYVTNTTETAGWYVIPPVSKILIYRAMVLILLTLVNQNANFSALANFSSVMWEMGYAYDSDNNQFSIGDAMQINMALDGGGPNITSLYSYAGSPDLNVTYLGPPPS